MRLRLEQFINAYLVTGDDNVKGSRLFVQVCLVPEVSEDLPLLGRAPVGDHLEGG